MSSSSDGSDDEHETISVRRSSKRVESHVPAAYALGVQRTEASVRARDLRRDRRKVLDDASDDGLVDTLHRWIAHHAAGALDPQGRVPVAYVYADGVHNSDAVGPFSELAARLERSGAAAAARLGPADFNGKQSMAALARTLLLRARPDAQPPVACTLQTLVGALADSPAGRRAATATAGIALLVTDLEAVQPARLCTAVSALHTARAAGLRAFVIAAVSTSPALVLPRLPARLQAITATSVYKLQAPSAAMDAALWRSQADLRPSGALLGGAMLRWVSRLFLELDFSAAVLPTMLRWAALRHSLQGAPAALLPALLSDPARLERACSAATRAELDVLLANCPRGANKPTTHAAKAADVLQHLQALLRATTTSQLALHALRAAATAAGTLSSFQARLWLDTARARGALRSTGAPVDTARGAIGLSDDALADFLHTTCARLARVSDDAARALAAEVAELVDSNDLEDDVTAVAAKVLQRIGLLAAPSEPSPPREDAEAPVGECDAAGRNAAIEQLPSPAGPTQPPKAVRRTHRQSAGAFLTAQASAVDSGAGSARTGPRGAPAKRSHGAEVAAAVGDLLLHALQHPPCACPCAQVLFYDDAAAATAALCPAPRLNVHHALLSGPPDLPDVCTAYGHLVTLGASIDLGAWFRAFCASRGACAASAPASTRRKGMARKQKRKKAKTVERSVEGPAAGALENGGGSGDEGAEDEEVEVEAGAVRELVARFSQAVAELQRMGFVSRGGRGARGALQRTAFPPDLT